MLLSDCKNLDQHFMGFAFREALKAYDMDEVPVGCVLVSKKKIIGRDHNRVEQLNDSTAHAEMLAITQASEALQSWRLDQVTLYTTLEPCVMCLGAIHLSRIGRVVWGAMDNKIGALGGCYDLRKISGVCLKTDFVDGVMAEDSLLLLKDFFKKLRKSKKGVSPLRKHGTAFGV